MDMKRILQALDSASTKPVQGAKDMSKFLSIVDGASKETLTEGSNPHKVTLPVQMAMQHYQPVTKPIVVNEKSNIKTSINKYFKEVKAEIQEEEDSRKQLVRQYASTIAERVLMKESSLKDKEDLKAKRKTLQDLSANKDVDQKHVQQRKLDLEKEAKAKGLDENEIPGHSMGFTGGVGPGLQDNDPVEESPIALDVDQPMKSMVHSHKGANPGSIEYRIMRARSQLKDLAQQAQSDDPIVWQHISRLFPELQMNIEQVAHGLEELARERRKGGVRSKNIPKDLDENFEVKKIKPKKKTSTCKAGQVQTGMQTKDGKLVPKCSVTKK